MSETINPHDHLGLVIDRSTQQIRKCGYRIELDEIVSYNYMIMHRAAEKFDPSMGYQFSTYACRNMNVNFAKNVTKCIHFGFHPSRPNSPKYKALMETQSHSEGQWEFIDEKAPDLEKQVEDKDTLEFFKTQCSEEEWAMLKRIVVDGDTFVKESRRWDVTRQQVRNRYLKIIERLQEFAQQKGLSYA